MKILANIDKQFENYKSTLAGLLKQKGFQALATTKTLTITELLGAAKSTKCDGILLANEETLQHCINSTRKVTLDKYRGTRLGFSIPTIVGAPLNHIRTLRYGRFLYETDLEKFNQIQQPITQLRFTNCTSRELLDACALRAEQALIISIDIETDGGSRITCISFTCLMPNLKVFCFVIPYITFGETFWADEDDYAYAIRTMQQICSYPAPKLFFNGLYDAQYLIAYNAEPVNFTLDAMGLAHAQYAELPKSLDAVASRHLYDYYFWKDEADEAKKKGDIQAYWAYCARDSFNTLRCFLAQIQSLPPYAVKNYQMLFKMVYPYLYCAFEGIKLDNNILKEKRRVAVDIANAAKDRLQTMAANKNFNPGSPKQVAILLYDVIGAKPPRGKKSTGEKVLEQISEQHPIVAAFTEEVLEYREKTKAIGTYYDFPQFNERLLYGINPFGTDTGRASASSSSFRMWDEIECEARSYGTQVQNIPMYAKEMMIADDEYELCGADNNKSEARCVAFLSKCPGLKQALSDPDKDFYRTLGTVFFGLPYEEVSKDLRNKVLKRIVHGRNYLMGAETFIIHTGSKQLYEGATLLKYPLKSLKEFAAYLLSQYNKPFPEINDWYNEVKLEILRTHCLTSPMGYTRYFFGDPVQDHKVFRNAVAHGPQNLSVMIINKGVWRVYNELVLTGNGEIRLKAQIHDEIFVQYKKYKREHYIPRIKECMNNPVVVHGDTLSIPVDVHTGRSWLDVKQ